MIAILFKALKSAVGVSEERKRGMSADSIANGPPPKRIRTCVQESTNGEPSYNDLRWGRSIKIEPRDDDSELEDFLEDDIPSPPYEEFLPYNGPPPAVHHVPQMLIDYPEPEHEPEYILEYDHDIGAEVTIDSDSGYDDEEINDLIIDEAEQDTEDFLLSTTEGNVWDILTPDQWVEIIAAMDTIHECYHE